MKTAIVLTTLALLCLPKLASAQNNLVVNGGFDTDASGWVIANVANVGGYASSAGNPAGSVFLFNPDFQINVPTASQEINSLIPGQLYIVSGDYRGGGKNVTDISFGVALDGVLLFETPIPAGNNWHSFSFDYNATSTSALLSLSSQLNGTDASYAIDNIAMTPTPEPNSLCLIGIGGFVGALLFRNRKRHSLEA